MTKPGILLCLLIVTVLFSASPTKADAPSWHKPIPCFGCHAETLDAPTGSGECGDCHSYKLPGGGVNVPLMQERHNPGICRACHIGNTAVNASDRDLFHNAHNAVQCIQCHMSGNATNGNATNGNATNGNATDDNNATISNATIVKIEEGRAFQCTSCHGNQIHSIHIKNLDQGCPICHGSWAAGKTYTGEGASSSQQNNSQENASLERFTIFSFIKNLFYALLGIK